MNFPWVLIFAIANSDQVLISEFPTEQSCQEKLQQVKQHFNEKINFIQCEEGYIVDEDEQPVNEEIFI